MKGRKRIAVVGSGGQVGSELVGLDWSSYLAEHKVELISFTRAELDVTNEASCANELVRDETGLGHQRVGLHRGSTKPSQIRLLLTP